jgi:hypothetical protein
MNNHWINTAQILIVYFFITYSCKSQVILTEANNPINGELQTLLICDTNSVIPGVPGPNQNWNFSWLSAIDTNITKWVSAASTPYYAQFSSSNIASTIDEMTFNFYKSSEQNILANGSAGSNAVIQYTNPQLFIQYPFSYGNSLTDSFSSNYFSGGRQIQRTGYITVLADASGAISLPYGIEMNSLRVKYKITTKDSSYNFIPIVVITELESYLWFSENKKFPVFEITYISVFFNGKLQNNFKQVNYNKDNVPIGIISQVSAIPAVFSLGQNYPNPFNPVTNIEFTIFQPEYTELTIYNSLGRLVAVLFKQNLSAGAYRVSFDAANFSSGIYFYTLRAGYFSKTLKMTLIK